MNHPIITTGNANARLNQLMQNAEQHRMAKGLPQQHRSASLLAKIGNRLIGSGRTAAQKRLANSSA